MNFIKLIESSHVEDIENGDLNESIIEDHYHKARIIQRAITNLDEETKEAVLGSWTSYIQNNTLVVDIDLIDQRCGDDVISELNSYQEENFILEASIIDGLSIRVVISQTFDGREDEMLYGDRLNPNR